MFLLAFSFRPAAQELPVKIFPGSDSTRPLLFYISGDGGLDNSFSSAFVRKLNALGYPVIGLNAKSYFWSRKKPQEAADAIGKLLTNYMGQWKTKSCILIGYSFGADVLPFIQRRLPAPLQAQNSKVILMSPSDKTDFEIHVLGMMGWGSSSGESVPAEVNKLAKPVVLVFGSDENEFPVKDIHLPNLLTLRLPGGHHYDGNVDEVVKQLAARMK